jgi:hypothetical protein
MSHWKFLALPALAGAVLLCGAAPAPAPAAAPQVSIGVNLGGPPVCPYGYFDYAPYNCAPYGYYGPDWFDGGVFIGAGPWYHRPHGWYGHVDNRYDPRHGYHGPFPDRGEQPFNHFHANGAIDGHGEIGDPHHDGGMEHRGGFAGGGHPGGGGHEGGHH